MEKRRAKRFPKRLAVRFGARALDCSGFTRDVSAGGAFIVSARLPALGTRLHVQLASEDQCWYFEAIVMRHRIVPAALRQLERNGFGVRFVDPGELFAELVPQSQSNGRFELQFATREKLRECLERELRFGGVFVRTDRPLSRDQAVSVEMQLPFARTSLEYSGRVVHVIGGANPGVAISFDQPDRVFHELARELE